MSLICLYEIFNLFMAFTAFFWIIFAHCAHRRPLRSTSRRFRATNLAIFGKKTFFYYRPDLFKVPRPLKTFKLAFFTTSITYIKMDKTTTSNNGSDGATGRALDSGSGDPGSSPSRGKIGTLPKNCKSFFIN